MHPDVDQIADLAFGEVEGAERALLMRHIASCDECREELETATLLVEASDRGILGAEAHVSAPRLRYYAAAAAVVLVVVGWFASRPVALDEDAMVAHAPASQDVAEPDDSHPAQDLTQLGDPADLPPGIPGEDRYLLTSTDEKLRERIVLAGRRRYPVDTQAASSLDPRVVARAMDSFEAGDFDGAAAELALEPTLPRDARALLGVSFYFGGWHDEARETLEGVVEGIIDLTERPQDVWGSDRDMALYFLARIHSDAGDVDEAQRIASLATDPAGGLWGAAAEQLLARLSDRSGAAE